MDGKPFSQEEKAKEISWIRKPHVKTPILDYYTARFISGLKYKYIKAAFTHTHTHTHTPLHTPSFRNRRCVCVGRDGSKFPEKYLKVSPDKYTKLHPLPHTHSTDKL